MASSVSNARQIKLIMDTFAMDHNGHFPNAQTAALYHLPTPQSSNDYFRQLFAGGYTNSEKIFWVKESKVTHQKKPDNPTTDLSGNFSPSQTLQPGDNHWAYVLNQTTTDNPSRPLLFDSPPTASGITFDPELWDLKAIVVRIDGSARPNRLNPSYHLLDGDNKQLLTPDSAVWDGTTPSIAYPAKR